MKQIIITFIIVSLLAPQFATAKNSDLVKVEYVQTSQNNTKGFPLLIAFIRIGYRVYRVASRVRNVARLVNRVRRYVDQYGIDRTQIAQRFAGDMKIALVDSFYAPKSSYKPFEKITLKAKLKQSAYTYIISLSNNGSCLLFPNGVAKKNLYQANQTYTFANQGYKFYADSRGTEHLYFVSSTKPLLSQLKSTFNIGSGTYSCGTRQNGKRKLDVLGARSSVEIKHLSVLIR